MNRRDRNRAKVLRYSIMNAIRRMAHAGFRVELVEVRKQDLKLVRYASPISALKVAGVDVQESTDDKPLGPGAFRILTNKPKTKKDAEEMFAATGMEMPEGGLPFSEEEEEPKTDE